MSGGDNNNLNVRNDTGYQTLIWKRPKGWPDCPLNVLPDGSPLDPDGNGRLNECLRPIPYRRFHRTYASRGAPLRTKRTELGWPRIAGDKIVWVDHRNDASGSQFNPRNSDIYLHDLATGKTLAVTTHPARQERADVWGDWVVWHDYRDAPDGVSGKEIDIFAKNMASGEEHQITDYPGLEAYPRVDHDRIFYNMDDLQGEWSLFMVDLAAFLAAKKP